MKQITKFICEGCNREYYEQRLAKRCEEQWKFQPDLGFEVGDIVRTGMWSTGWLEDSDPLWVAEVEFDSHYNRDMYHYYFVVTAITDQEHYSQSNENPHSKIVHVYSKANNSYSKGWTRKDGHIGMIKVENPPEGLKEAAQQYVGMTFNHLL